MTAQVPPESGANKPAPDGIERTSGRGALFKKILASFERFGQEVGAGIMIGYVLGALTYIACFIVAFKMPPYDEWWLNMLLCLFGGIVGWSLGVLLSPMTKDEESKFTNYGRAVSAFVSGFLVAKLDLLLNSIPPDVHLASIVMVGRGLLFGTALFVGFQFTFVVRWRSRPPGAIERNDKTREAPAG